MKPFMLNSIYNDFFPSVFYYTFCSIYLLHLIEQLYVCINKKYNDGVHKMHSVLIVDDECLIHEGIAEGIDWSALECSKPLVAENGIEAVELIKNNHIDVVITDIKMPGMNGLELAEWISTNFNTIKVIILTGYDDFKFAQSALKYGVVDFILKPTKLEEIENAILKIKKKLTSEEQKQRIYEESSLIIEKNKIDEINRIINSIIFNRFDNIQKLKKKMESMDFNPCLLRIALIEVKNQPHDYFGDGNSKILYYIDDMVYKINLKAQNTKIKFLSQFESDCLIIFFFSESITMKKSKFSRLTEEIISEVEGCLNKFVPFDITMGISGVDEDIYNARKLYYDALKKCDASKQKKYWSENLNVTGCVDVSDIITPKYSIFINEKDLQGINEEIEAFLNKLKDNPMVQLKSAAIEFINYTLWLISKNYVTKSIGREKVYSRIINAIDPKDIEHVIKETLRKICISMDIFLQESENDEMEERVISYIRANFFNNLTLESVADRFYISSGHLSRVLKKSCGKTFVDILTQIRIENAKILLRNPRFKTYEVAEAVGFNDPKYFSQVFKKYTGKTPSEYK